MKILIVEDDLASREYLKNAIEIEGHDYRWAVNGKEGLAVYEEFKPELILSDIQMPVMDGLELLEELRNRKVRVIFIMITAFSTEDYAIKAFHLGANNYLKKPIRQSDLLELLQKYDSILKSRKAIIAEIPGKLTRREFTLEINSNPDMIPKVVDFLITETGHTFGNDERTSIELGLVELLTNSVEHGNLEISYEEKAQALSNNSLEELFAERRSHAELACRHVALEYTMNQDFCQWIIKDQGEGFDWEDIIYNIKEDKLFDLNGRGIFICQFLFDEMEFLGNGNTVRVRKYIDKNEEE